MNDGIPATVLPWSDRRFPPLRAEKYTPRGIWLISCFTSDVKKTSNAEKKRVNIYEKELNYVCLKLAEVHTVP